VSRLNELGFVDAFIHEEYIVKGNAVQYVMAYPNKWSIWADGDDGASVFLGESAARPDYNKISDVIEANGIAPLYSRQSGLGGNKKPLVGASITVFYEDE
jgi:hypothetical protein